MDLRALLCEGVREAELVYCLVKLWASECNVTVVFRRLCLIYEHTCSDNSNSIVNTARSFSYEALTRAEPLIIL